MTIDPIIIAAAAGGGGALLCICLCFCLCCATKARRETAYDALYYISPKLSPKSRSQRGKNIWPPPASPSPNHRRTSTKSPNHKTVELTDVVVDGGARAGHKNSAVGITCDVHGDHLESHEHPAAPSAPSAPAAPEMEGASEESFYDDYPPRYVPELSGIGEEGESNRRTSASSRPSLASVGKKPSLSARLSSGVDHLQRASLGASLGAVDSLRRGSSRRKSTAVERAGLAAQDSAADLELDEASGMDASGDESEGKEYYFFLEKGAARKKSAVDGHVAVDSVHGPFSPYEMKELYEEGKIDERTKVRWLPVAYARPNAADQPAAAFSPLQELCDNYGPPFMDAKPPPAGTDSGA